jgi:mono/diheme cytochrome c family protein
MVRALRYLAATIAMVALVGCGGSPAGDPARGQALFHGQADLGDASVPTCISCHAIKPGEPADIGTNLSNIGNRARTEVADQSAEAYLRTSITAPDAHLAGGFHEGIIYRRYGDVLTGAQINDLVAYMSTLQSGTND